MDELPTGPKPEMPAVQKNLCDVAQELIAGIKKGYGKRADVTPTLLDQALSRVTFRRVENVVVFDTREKGLYSIVQLGPEKVGVRGLIGDALASTDAPEKVILDNIYEVIKDAGLPDPRTPAAQAERSGYSGGRGFGSKQY